MQTPQSSSHESKESPATESMEQSNEQEPTSPFESSQAQWDEELAMYLRGLQPSNKEA